MNNGALSPGQCTKLQHGQHTCGVVSPPCTSLQVTKPHTHCCPHCQQLLNATCNALLDAAAWPCNLACVHVDTNPCRWLRLSWPCCM
jgi:hypothetical protein